MSDIQKKLEDYLNGDDDIEYYPEEDINIMERMMEFIMNINSDNLSEDQVDELTEIIDYIADGSIDSMFEDDMDEEFSAKKVKIKASDKRKRRMEYRRNRAALKLKAKKFRRTTAYKQWARKKKRKASQGKTATGKRIRQFL